MVASFPLTPSLVFTPADSRSQMVGAITHDLWHDLCSGTRAKLPGTDTHAQISLGPLDLAEALAIVDDRCLALSEAPLSIDR